MNLQEGAYSVVRRTPERSPAIGVLTVSLLLLLALWSPFGCAVRNPLTIERPNARTQLEQQAYNTLLVSERIISTAELSNSVGTLPEYMKPIINQLIDIHNEAKKVADDYVALLDAGTEEEGFAALSSLLLDLDRLISSLFNNPGGEP